MKLEILQVPDCPNVAVLEDRIRRATAGHRIVLEISHRFIDDPDEAAAAGMAGSPTLLVDGVDPFAAPGQVPSVSCRLYRSESGGMDGAPTVGALRAALQLEPIDTPEDSRAGEGPSADSCCNDLSFFTDRGTAQRWSDAHPHLDGTILDLPDAHRLGNDIFGTQLQRRFTFAPTHIAPGTPRLRSAPSTTPSTEETPMGSTVLDIVNLILARINAGWSWASSGSSGPMPL
ncbi:organomercurial lyase [Nocardia sp. CA-151230]|uniref:organomercurial lyase n=1 Tax=Nocardia sp. CA-151230 TaxID=3239982 RepID=UPI003D8C205C